MGARERTGHNRVAVGFADWIGVANGFSDSVHVPDPASIHSHAVRIVTPLGAAAWAWLIPVEVAVRMRAAAPQRGRVAGTCHSRCQVSVQSCSRGTSPA
jgi:hypothetical protein